MNTFRSGRGGGIVPFTPNFGTRWRWVWLILIHVPFERLRTMLEWIFQQNGSVWTELLWVGAWTRGGLLRTSFGFYYTRGTYWLADELLVSEVLLHAAIFSRFKIFAINESTPTVSSDVFFYAEDDALSTVWMRPMNSRTPHLGWVCHWHCGWGIVSFIRSLLMGGVTCWAVIVCTRPYWTLLDVTVGPEWFSPNLKVSEVLLKGKDNLVKVSWGGSKDPFILDCGVREECYF